MTIIVLSIVIIVLQLVNFFIMCIAILQGRKLQKIWNNKENEDSRTD